MNEKHDDDEVILEGTPASFKVKITIHAVSG